MPRSILPKRRPWCVAAFVLFAATALVRPQPARACDLCAIYTGSLMQQDKTGLMLGVSEQYTDFGSIRSGEHDLPNPGNEWMKSSITQLVIGYSFTPRIGVQANVPLISREYRRLEDGAPVRGDVGGLGDVSFIGRFSPLSRAVGEALVHVELFAGLKTPTGNSDRLAEELGHHDDEDGDHHGAAARRAARGHGAAAPHGARHGGEEHESAIHGHDLALGSGSVDGLFGAAVHASWERLFAEASVQYVVRGNGEFSYEYANDLAWEIGPGLYVVTQDSWTLATSMVASGENKGRDHQKGSLADDTAITSVYVGPSIALTWSDAMHADFVIDLPVMQDVTGTQIVADYRLRAGLTWRF